MSSLPILTAIDGFSFTDTSSHSIGPKVLSAVMSPMPSAVDGAALQFGFFIRTIGGNVFKGLPTDDNCYPCFDATAGGTININSAQAQINLERRWCHRTGTAAFYVGGTDPSDETGSGSSDQSISNSLGAGAVGLTLVPTETEDSILTTNGVSWGFGADSGVSYGDNLTQGGSSITTITNALTGYSNRTEGAYPSFMISQGGIDTEMDINGALNRLYTFLQGLTLDLTSTLFTQYLCNQQTGEGSARWRFDERL